MYKNGAGYIHNILIACGLVFIFLLIVVVPVQAGDAAGTPQITATAALLMDATTGEVLYTRNPDERRAPASTTKILTALVALEEGELDDLITVGPNPPRVEGTRIYLEEGETVRLEDLLYGMMLNSGNDAALAIAEHYGGSADGFARLMNKKAAELGASHSHFVTSNGLSAPEHHTTARDLALIARAAMQEPTFRQIVATKTRSWHGQAWESSLLNRNGLLWSYEGASGIKTGYTSEARNCLVGSATRGNQNLIAVVLDVAGRKTAEQEVAALLDYGFQEFCTINLARSGQIMTVLETKKGQKIELAADRSLVVTCRREDSFSLPAGQVRMYYVRGPAEVGTIVGEMVFQHKSKTMGKVNLVNQQVVPAPPLSAGDWWLRLSLVLIGLWLLLLLRNYLRVRRLRRSYINRKRSF